MKRDNMATGRIMIRLIITIDEGKFIWLICVDHYKPLVLHITQSCVREKNLIIFA